mmetsp:Transcript_51147/g.147593  ORF Transcript_51147/g.147593 Transcript_51147/m.147593 type:complete len:349 (-) Transcript_51147:79-1125(-)
MSTGPPPEAKSIAKFSDGISALQYFTASQQATEFLAATSWDGTLRVLDTADKSVILTQTMESGPLLSLATMSTPNKTILVTGGADGSVKMMEVETSTVTLLGKHDVGSGPPTTPSSVGVSCLAAFPEHQLVASASWNRQLCLWDVRNPGKPLSTIELPGKAFAMDVDVANQRLIIATSGRRNVVVAVKNAKDLEKVLDRDSSLKFQTRCISFFPSHGFAVGSVEGRVAVEYLAELGQGAGKKKYAFKCHRVNDIIYPVNCLKFHPRYQTTFCTGGCDGSVVLWDGGNKKKLTTLPTFPTSISALAFSQDGKEIAIASSYTFEDGDREHPQDELFVRRLLDSECMPKSN